MAACTSQAPKLRDIHGSGKQAFVSDFLLKEIHVCHESVFNNHYYIIPYQILPYICMSWISFLTSTSHHNHTSKFKWLCILQFKTATNCTCVLGLDKLRSHVSTNMLCHELLFSWVSLSHVGGSQHVRVGRLICVLPTPPMSPLNSIPMNWKLNCFPYKSSTSFSCLLYKSSTSTAPKQVEREPVGCPIRQQFMVQSRMCWCRKAPSIVPMVLAKVVRGVWELPVHRFQPRGTVMRRWVELYCMGTNERPLFSPSSKIWGLTVLLTNKAPGTVGMNWWKPATN